MPLALLGLLGLLGCQEPFGTDRHALTGFRIAALGAPVVDGVVRPSAALVVDGRLWSDAPVTLRWAWVDDPDQLADVDALDIVATGPAPALPIEPRTLGLVATSPDGVERAAFVDILGPPMPELDPTWEALPLDVATVAAADLGDPALVGEVAASVPVGGFARLSAGAPLTRWMATGGTFFEVDRRTADWAAGVVEVDDGEIVAREPLPPGLVTVLVLGLDDGRTTWDAIDVPVGEEPVGAWVDGRFLPADAPHVGPIAATLVADDHAPTGLRLVDVGPAEGAPPELPCAVGVFDPDWLADGRCTRSALDGARVHLIAEAP